MKYESPTCHCNSRPLNIDLGPFDRDERVDRVDHILELLIESRYGPGRYYQPFEVPHTMMRTEPVSFELMPEGFKIFFSNDSCSVLGSNQSANTANELGLRSPTTSNAFSEVRHSPSTLARGSPNHRRPCIDS